MKKVIFGAALLALAFTANAQDKKGSDKSLKFGVGVTAGLPIGDLKTAGGSFAIGGDVQAEYAAAETVGITLSAGYLNVSFKNGGGSTGLIPVLVGGKFTFGEKFYGHAQVGMSFSTQSGGGSAFTYAPGFGYQVSENFDLGVKYQAWTKNSFTSSIIGLRAAYSF